MDCCVEESSCRRNPFRAEVHPLKAAVGGAFAGLVRCFGHAEQQPRVVQDIIPLKGRTRVLLILLHVIMAEDALEILKLGFGHDLFKNFA